MQRGLLVEFYCCSNHLSQQQMISQWAKLLVGYLVKEWGLQENSIRSPHCICPLYIYMAPGPCYNNIYLDLKSIPLPHVLLLIHMCLSWGHHTSYMCSDIIFSILLHCPMSYFLISVVHVYTMCAPWGTLVPWHYLLTLTLL